MMNKLDLYQSYTVYGKVFDFFTLGQSKTFFNNFIFKYLTFTNFYCKRSCVFLKGNKNIL